MENRQHSQDRPTEETPTLYNIFLSTQASTLGPNE